MRPPGHAIGRRYVDFMFGLDYLSPNSELVRMFREAMAPFSVAYGSRHQRDTSSSTAAKGSSRSIPAPSYVPATTQRSPSSR